MAGFGAASFLQGKAIRATVYDKNNYYGGHTASLRDENGFLFDLGPHISFSKDPRIQELFAKYVDQKYEAVQVQLDNYWRGLRLIHPDHHNLIGIPKDLIVEIVADFVKEQGVERKVKKL